MSETKPEFVVSYETKLKSRAKEINDAISKGRKLFYSNKLILKITTEPGWGLEAHAIVGDGTEKYNCGSQIFDNILNEKGEKFVTN